MNNVKNCTYHYFNDMINIKNLDPNKIKIEEKSYKSILIFCIRYVTVKDLSYTIIISVSFLYLIINKINGYIEESSKNKYLTLAPTNESKVTIKKCKEL